ncbi:MAG TPA: amidohydrolase [Miltoncostaeaceae bacterium]|nr:amidohydrolase [Miltoncostaeaceae bacterium]
MRGGRVAWLGDLAGARARAGRRATTLDLGGGCAVPGITDAHLHLLGHALVLDQVRLEEAGSLGDISAAVSGRAATLAPGGWVVGRGWDQERLAERRMPDRRDLDAAAPGVPVVLTRVCGHVLVASGTALERAGIRAGTPDPAGGAIDRDAGGEPTGVLRERAMDLVRGLVPRPHPGRMAELLTGALRRCLELGITQVQTDDVDSAGGLEAALDLFRACAGPDGVPVRVTLMIPIRVFDEARRMGIGTGWGDAWLRAGHVKVFADGSLGARTAALRAPYADAPGTTGILTYEDAEMAEMAARVHAAGSQLGVHAIGDRASHQVLSAVAAAQRAHPRPDARHRVIHCQITGPDTLRAYRSAGIVADVQPVFLGTDAAWLVERVGDERAAASYAWRSMIELGIPVATGSDCPIEPLDPVAGLACAVTRTDRRGRPPGGFAADERLTVAQALDGATRGAAFATFEEDVRGTLEPGMLADLTVLDRDPFLIPPEELWSLRARVALMEGRPVEAQPLAPPSSRPSRAGG